jgi:DNA-binding transcriptional regulator YiaG
VSPGGVTDEIAADLDAHEDPTGELYKPHPRFLALAQSAAALGVGHAFVGNTSRGGKGRHARLCVGRTTPAWLARQIGLAWLEHAGIEPEPATGTPEHATWLALFGATPDGGVEVYPKQDDAKDGYGNLLAVPCSGQLYEEGGTVLLELSGTAILWDRVLTTLRAVKPLSLDEVKELARKLGIDPEVPETVLPNKAATSKKRPSNSRSRGNATPYTKIVLNAVDFEKALTWLALSLPDAGGRMDCPLHTGGQHPRTLSIGGDLFNCFSSRCGRGGNVITFVADYRGTTYVDARDWLAAKAGVALPDYFPTPTAKPAPEDPKGKLLATLTTPGAALLDSRPMGVGKSYQAGETVAANELKGQTLIFAPNHKHHDDELLPLIRGANVLGRENLVSKWPKPECPEGHTELLKQVSQRGYSYPRVVCAICPRRDESEAKKSGVPFCSLKRAQAKAIESETLLVQHTHAGIGDAFWNAGIGANAGRAVFDENPVQHLAREVRVTERSLARYEEALADATSKAKDALKEEILDFGPDYASSTVETVDHGPGKADRAPALERVLAAFRAFQGAAKTALGNSGHVVEVMRPSDEAWRGLLVGEDLAVAHEAVERSLTGRSKLPPSNMLPLAAEAAKTWVKDRAFVLFRVKSFEEAAIGLVRANIPANVSVAVLDATGNREVLERLLGRPVAVLDGGSSAQVQVLQITNGGLRSKTRLANDPLSLNKDARIAARRITQERIGKGEIVGVVSYKAQVEPLIEAIRRTLRRWRNRGQTMPEFRSLHWFAARGSNGLKGAALVIVHGCPTPNPHAIRRLAYLMGATVAELREEPALTPVKVVGSRTCNVMSYGSPILERCRRALQDAELRQGLGRSTRGATVPRAGVLALTTYPIDFGVVLRTTAKEAGLDRDQRGALGGSRHAPGESPATSDISVVTNDLSREKCQSEGAYEVSGSSSHYDNSPAEIAAPTLVSAHSVAPLSPEVIAQLVETVGPQVVANATGASTRTVSRWVKGESRPRAASATSLRALWESVLGKTSVS